MDLQLRGLRAVLTGGTRGIGRAIAETLASEGANVAICARDGDEVEAAVNALRASGVTAAGRALDVGNAAALTAWVRDAARELGGVDIAIGNVSAFGGDAENADVNWSKSFEIDVMHAVHLVDAALPWLEKSAAGSIVTISGVSGRDAGPHGAVKAALIHYTQSLALQLAPKGIRANTVSPGNTYCAGGAWATVEREDPARFARALALNPTGRMGTPEEVARAVVFIASPAASFITGANLAVDGALSRGLQL